MHTHKESIDATLSDTKVYLDKLHQEISKTLEKVASREKYINNQVEKKKQYYCVELMIELSVSCHRLNVMDFIFFFLLLLLMKLEHHIQEFRSCQDRLAEVRDKYKEGSTGVNDLTRELAQVNEIIILIHAVIIGQEPILLCQ